MTSADARSSSSEAIRSAAAPERRDGRPDTTASDYAKLNAVYGVGLAAILIGTRHRGLDDPIRSPELVPIGAATFALAKVIAREKMGTWVREPFVEQAADGGGHSPRGRGVRHAVGELVTCTRCVGAWSAMAVVGLRVASPRAGRTVTAVLASSAVSDWMQVGFRLLCSQSNAARD